MANRIDTILKEILPEIRCTTKCRKLSQPLAEPFHGLLAKGWMFVMWFFKKEFAVGFIEGTLLDPEPLNYKNGRTLES